VSAGPLVVSVHALDTGLGEGFVADAAVTVELECRAACVATSVLTPEPLSQELVARQWEAAREHGPVGAVRVGFLHGAAQAEGIASLVRGTAPVVLAAALTSGATKLIDAETQRAIVKHLYPAARVVVVRAADLAAIVGREVDDLDGLRDAAAGVRGRGARAAIVAGLSWRGRVLDLVDDGGAVSVFDTARFSAPRIPGLSGAYGAALAAHLARGLALPVAAEAAQRYVGFRLARGR